jgi:solute carrier family 25 (mitochondrial carnitine/acylcarnitine transporter), member 20/29
MLLDTFLWKDYFIGGIVGVSQGIVGHPFDTIKVVYQNKSSLNSTRIHNIVGLYRGVNYPVYASFLTNVTLFPIYEKVKRDILIQHNITYNSTNTAHWPSYIAGTIGGLLSTPVVYITDTAKIKKQMNPNSIINYRKIIKHKGLLLTTYRECIASGFYFYTYDKLNSNHNSFFSGGMAGCVAWTITYPIDVLKTQQMTTNYSIKKCIQLNKNTRDYWRGYTPCLIRSFIVNGVTFYVYDNLKYCLYNSDTTNTS